MSFFVISDVPGRKSAELEFRDFFLFIEDIFQTSILLKKKDRYELYRFFENVALELESNSKIHYFSHTILNCKIFPSVEIDEDRANIYLDIGKRVRIIFNIKMDRIRELSDFFLEGFKNY